MEIWSVVVTNAVGRSGLPDPERVFEKYYRSPKASYRSGSGLGLYLVLGLVQEMGGNLRYEPQDEIARFILTMQSQKTEVSA